MVKNLPTNAGDTRETDSIPGLRSSREEIATHSWKTPWTESLAGYNLWGSKESDMTESTHTYTHTHTHTHTHTEDIFGSIVQPVSVDGVKKRERWSFFAVVRRNTRRQPWFLPF